MKNLTRPFVWTLLAGMSFSAAQGDVAMTGVNLAGAEFGTGGDGLPGVYDKHYTYPRTTEIDYFIEKGMNVFRLPFRWERLQRELGAEFHAEELKRLNKVVEHATQAGAFLVLDPHNQARYGGKIIGSGEVTNEHFADFWTRLAELYKDNGKVIFGLINEPHGLPTEQWVETANVAIAAIRETGATNLILVPGNGYSGAHSWSAGYYGTPNAKALLQIRDPGNNFAIEPHQYLDGDSSGRSETIVSPTIGAERLEKFTQWARQHKMRAFLGEFAVANAKIGDGPEQIGDEALDHMLGYMAANDDVWIGWTWWAAGPWWSNYMFTLHPIDLGKPTQTDRPALKVLQRHLAGSEASASATTPASAQPAPMRTRISNGDFETDANGDGLPDGWPKSAHTRWEQEEDGNRFLRIEPTKPGTMVTVYRGIELKDELTHVNITARVRTHAVRPGPENWHDARIILHFLDGWGGQKLNPSPGAITFPQDTGGQWRTVSKEVVVPRGAKILEIMPAMFHVESGQFDLDDVALTPAEPQ